MERAIPGSAATWVAQATGAILFLCREVLGVNVEGLSPSVKAKRGQRLPVVLSMPETMALLDAMSGTPRLMAALIYGGGLRVSECCELRIKDLDQRPVDAARGGWKGGTACSPARVVSGTPSPGCDGSVAGTTS